MVDYTDNSGTSGGTGVASVMPVIPSVPLNNDRSPTIDNTVYGLQTVPNPLIAPGNMDNHGAG